MSNDQSGLEDSAILAMEYAAAVAMLLGGFISSGNLSYFRHSSNLKDSLYLKTFVGILWALAVVQVIITGCSLAYVTNWHESQKKSNSSPLPEAVNQYLNAQFICSGIIVSMIQGFFSYRLRILTDSWILPSVCWFLGFLRCTGVVVLGIIPLLLRYSIFEWLGKNKGVFSAVLAGSIFIDINVTASMTVMLYKRKKLGFRSIHRVINRIIAWSIMSGLITTLLTATILILSVLNENLACFSGFLLLSRVFGIVFITSLNERHILRRLDETAGSQFNLNLSHEIGFLPEMPHRAATSADSTGIQEAMKEVAGNKSSSSHHPIVGGSSALV